ncbi:MAG: hypothetical protein U0996_20840 [Planctomycetaceae bacterium]
MDENATKKLSDTGQSPSWGQWLLAVVIGCLLTGYVWIGILRGGGLNGGDTYPYFFPQKQLMAEEMKAGRLPLWHDRTALGYPLLAESQAGVFYPSNQILYRVLDVHTAYHVSFLLHYVAAFVFSWRFVRTQRLSNLASLFAAGIFVFGWFPARASLEWSIIGGVWLPVALWRTDCLLLEPSRKNFALLAIVLAIHLLAGHFTLAFITQLACLGYSILRSPNQRVRRSVAVVAAIALSGALAAVQLLPTLELRSHSQRASEQAGSEQKAFDPGYGHMPPVYVTQLVASWWYWHTPEVIESREMLKANLLKSSADTNAVEAHLYVGLIPLILVLTLANPSVRRRLPDSLCLRWLIIAALGLVYSFGWLIPVTRSLPGFGFFMGPARYSVLTTLGLAILAGASLDAVTRRTSIVAKAVMVAMIGCLTLVDVTWSSRAVCDAVIVSDPPWKGLKESWIAATLQKENQQYPVRVLTDAKNIANLYGVSSVPQYLGLGPSEYFSEEFRLQTRPESDAVEYPDVAQIKRLRSLAVTHLLTTEPIGKLSPEFELVRSAPDAFLNRVWGRGMAPCYLYRFREPPFRVGVLFPTELSLDERSEPPIAVHHYRSTPTVVEFDLELGAKLEVRVSDLMFPGWTVEIDGVASEAVSRFGLHRVVAVPAGKHHVRWAYAPQSFQLGWITSLLSLMSVIILAWRRRVC